jgi:D-alanine-D-alanine ligase
MKVAVVHNSNKDGVINSFGQVCPESYGAGVIALVADALRARGYTVAALEGDKSLLARLEELMPPSADRQPDGMVFNLAYGIQGNCRYTHVPALLEMAGIPYTGSSPLGHALALDKVITKVLLRDAGLPTPAYIVLGKDTGISRHPDLGRPGTPPVDLRYPLVVKPRHESTSYGLHLVHDPKDLKAAVACVVEQYQQEALVEEYIDGREVCIGLLGNDPLEALPAVELDFSERPTRLMTWDDKMHKRLDEPRKVCPAVVGEEMTSTLEALARATFRACHCQDYARVDIRIDAHGQPFVLEVNSMASLGLGGSFVSAARVAGYSFEALVNRILDVAHFRYFGQHQPAQSPESAVQSQKERELVAA